MALRATATRLLLLLLLLAPTATSAATCDTRGNVVLVAGQNDSEAIVIDADCWETNVVVSDDTLMASNLGIEKVLSAPDVKDMCVRGCQCLVFWLATTSSTSLSLCCIVDNAHRER